MSSERIVVILLLAACADFRRGESWDESTDDAATADVGEESDSGAPPGSESGSGSGSQDDADDDGSGEPPPSFGRDVLPILRDGCERCHSASGEASDTDFVLGADEAAAYAMTLEFIDLAAPAASRLLGKAAGKGHIGGVVFDDRTREYETILQWIEQGAMP